MIQNGSVYDNNYARAAAYYLGTCAPAPAAGPRLAAHALLTGMYRAIFDGAAALGFRTAADKPFAPWEQQKGREKDIKSIRDPIARIEALIAEFFGLVEAGEPAGTGLLLPPGAAPKRQLAALPRREARQPRLCQAAWKHNGARQDGMGGAHALGRRGEL